MNHPKDLLLEFALGELSAQQEADVALHLQTCRSCQEELQLIQESLIMLSESVTPDFAPESAWEVIKAKTSQQDSVVTATKGKPSWQPWALAASLVIALGGVFWGYQQQQQIMQVQTEQRKVAGWLSRPDVERIQLLDEQGERLGSVLTLSDGRALFILRQAPPQGFAYQAWGESNGQQISLGLSNRSLLEVSYEGYDYIATSLEPAKGSEQPIELLGGVPIERTPGY